MILRTADRIRELRTKNNLTQADLARLLYVTRSSVNAWEMAVAIPLHRKNRRALSPAPHNFRLSAWA